MSRTSAAKSRGPHPTHQATEKTLPRTNHSLEPPKSMLAVDSTKPVQRPEKKASKPLASFLGIGQNFVAPKSDEADGLKFSSYS
jgi:hypothetical protein